MATQNESLPEVHHWHNPSGDGNCLFHAFERAFDDLGTHEDIREAVAVAAETSDLGDHAEGLRQEFLKAIRQPNEYTGPAESAIQFAAVAFDTHIR